MGALAPLASHLPLNYTFAISHTTSTFILIVINKWSYRCELRIIVSSSMRACMREAKVTPNGSQLLFLQSTGSGWQAGRLTHWRKIKNIHHKCTGLATLTNYSQWSPYKEICGELELFLTLERKCPQTPLIWFCVFDYQCPNFHSWKNILCQPEKTSYTWYYKAFLEYICFTALYNIFHFICRVWRWFFTGG